MLAKQSLMHRRSIRFLFILFLYPSFSFAGEWGQWYHKTPGKNLISNLKISDKYRNIFSCRTYDTVSIHYLEKWYFYKKHIVGKYEFDQPNKYFIINEKTCVVADYSSYQDLQHALIEKKLEPLIWTRWHNDNWGYFFEGEGMGGSMDWFFIRGTWILLPIVIILAVMLLFNQVYTNYGRLIYLVIVMITGARILLDIYPISI